MEKVEIKELDSSRMISDVHAKIIACYLLLCHYSACTIRVVLEKVEHNRSVRPQQRAPPTSLLLE